MANAEHEVLRWYGIGYSHYSFSKADLLADDWQTEDDKKVELTKSQFFRAVTASIGESAKRRVKKIDSIETSLDLESFTGWAELAKELGFS